MAARIERYPRGSFPPYLTLSEAFSLAEKIYENAGGQASYDLLSQITGNSTSSSSFIKKLAALKSYGIVVEPSKGEVVLSEVGVAIGAPVSPEAAAMAKKEAFLHIETLAKVFERHKGKLVPADEFLRNILEQDCGIPRGLSDSWVSFFKDAARAAGLLYDRGDGKMQIMESPVVARTTSTSGSSVATPDTVPAREAPRPGEYEPSVAVPFGSSGHNSKIELSGRRYALFSIPDSLTGRDAQRLKSALAGLASIIDSMVHEEQE